MRSVHQAIPLLLHLCCFISSWLSTSWSTAGLWHEQCEYAKQALWLIGQVNTVIFPNLRLLVSRKWPRPRGPTIMWLQWPRVASAGTSVGPRTFGPRNARIPRATKKFAHNAVMEHLAQTPTAGKALTSVSTFYRPERCPYDLHCICHFLQDAWRIMFEFPQIPQIPQRRNAH